MNQMNWKMLVRNVIFTLSLGGLLLVSACEHANEVEHYSSPDTENLDLPFSAAVRVGNTLYLSGSLGNIPGKLELVPGGIKAETRQTMENIRATLKLASSSMNQLVKCSVFMADISEWGEMNEVYRTFFTIPPARSAFGTSGLALGARVEIDCIAAVD